MSDSLYDHAFESAMKQARDVGTLLGNIVWVLKYGELNDNGYKTLSQAYLKVVGEDEFHATDIAAIREELSRRGIVLG